MGIHQFCIFSHTEIILVTYFSRLKGDQRQTDMGFKTLILKMECEWQDYNENKLYPLVSMK